MVIDPRRERAVDPGAGLQRGEPRLRDAAGGAEMVQESALACRPDALDRIEAGA